MAPQTASHYGALAVEPKHNVKAGKSRTLVAAAAVVLSMTVAVFAFTSVSRASPGKRVGSTANIAQEREEDVFEGSVAPDCSCAFYCSLDTGLMSGPNDSNQAVAKGFTDDGLHYCAVNPADTCNDDAAECTCVGVNQRTFTKVDLSRGCVWTAADVTNAKTRECTDVDSCSTTALKAAGIAVDVNDVGGVNYNCMATCEYIFGRYDCAANGKTVCENGFCVDGADTFDCICDDGFTGTHCEEDVSECSVQDVDSDDDGTLEVYAVCNENAKCEEAEPGYKCTCNSGYGGDGYREYVPVKMETPAWVVRPTYEWVEARCSDPAYVTEATCQAAFAEWYLAKCSNEVDTPAGSTRFATTTQVDCTKIVLNGAGSYCSATSTLGCNADADCAVAAMCAETAGWLTSDSSDATDKAACLGVADLGSSTACIAVQKSASGASGSACSYRAEVVEDTCNTVNNFVQGCTDVNSCSHNPCQNGATCVNNDGLEGRLDYECLCARDAYDKNVAWIGKNCEEDVNECVEEGDVVLHDCDPHAECVNERGSFSCSCNEHWTSYDDDDVDRKGRVWVDSEDTDRPGCFDYDDCGLEEPCKHGGTCEEGPAGCETVDHDTGEISIGECYACQCALGWTGFDCESDENECKDSDSGDYETIKENCSSHAFCSNTPGSYECACNAGWTGDGIMCVDADDCEFSPCGHGGTCYDCGTLCFSCDCVAGWRGTTCGTDWNECLMGIHQCSDEATCVNSPGSYDCRCDPGFTGDGFGQGFEAVTTVVVLGSTTITEVDFKGCKDIDDCDPELFDGAADSPNGPCKMGLCSDVGPNAYVCTCNQGYTDANCDMDINECDPVMGDNDCHRFATCTNNSGSYLCACKDGFTGDGRQCQDMSDCQGQCLHGTCSDMGVSEFKCLCDQGWTDTRCDKDENECALFTHQCSRHADCFNKTNGQGCQDAGAVDVVGTSCLGDSCGDEKIWSSEGKGYCCACNTGWVGDGWNLYSGGSTGCTDYDDCASNPCDRGVCTDQGEGAYTCACEEGFTDYNCDFDVNECYLGTHDCHVDARCVNVEGGYFCRCLAGWEGDGFTCTDLDDCDPDPCDAVHGTCEDQGSNSYVCNCEPGWCGLDCVVPCNECRDHTDNCDANALCADTYGSYDCTCNNGFYGNGAICSPCTECPTGYDPMSKCLVHDIYCENINECNIETDTCNAHAACIDTEGSYKCECVQAATPDDPTNEWYGIGADTSPTSGDGCDRCNVCYEGYHEIQPCTSTENRQCVTDVQSGLYMLESEADDDRQCIAMLAGEWYPSRINFGNGEDFCGIMGGESCDPDSERFSEDACKNAKIENLVANNQALWKFTALFNNVSSSTEQGGDLFTIEHDGEKGYRCLFFGDQGKDYYPSLQNCDSFPLDKKDECPWDMGGQGFDVCGYSKAGMEQDPVKALVENGQAVWKVTALKLNEKKFLLQSASKPATAGMGNVVWECLTFEQQGAATNPSRYNWGDGDGWCGAGDWEGQGQVSALLSNKQAVFMLTYLRGA